MKVERTFSPKKIIIESVEDQDFILTVLKSAFQNEDRSWRSKDNSFIRKLMDLERDIRL